MFKFESTYYFIYLLTAVALCGFYFGAKYISQRRETKLGEPEILFKIKAFGQKSTQLISLFSGLVGLILLSISLTNPQLGRKKEKVNVSSSDVFIVLDISNSMLCEDIRPSRLVRAKLFATKLVDKLKGERLGLIVFAGSAYVQIPITTDYATLKMFIEAAHPDQAGTQGTNIAEAINMCVDGFPKEDERPGAIIIITDGENHEEEDIVAAQRAAESGYKCYMIGVGTEKGGQIPIKTRSQRDVKRDSKGQVVITALDKETIVNLAREGGGKSFLISEGEKVYSAIVKDVEVMEKTRSDELLFAEFVSYYQYFLGPAILMFLFEFLVPWKKIIA